MLSEKSPVSVLRSLSVPLCSHWLLQVYLLLNWPQRLGFVRHPVLLKLIATSSLHQKQGQERCLRVFVMQRRNSTDKNTVLHSAGKVHLGIRGLCFFPFVVGNRKPP